MSLRTFYYVYEQRLLRQIRRRPSPRHVGIILDGNRRHGRSLGLTDPRAIYGLGAQKLDDMLDWCAELGIPVVTLWVFSTDNLQRSPEEVTGIFGAIEAKMAALASDPQIHRRRVRVRAIGELTLVPASTLAAIRSAEQATRAYNAMQLNIAVAYGGREEIVDAVRGTLRKMASEGATLSEAIERLTPDAIAGRLYTAGLPDPDLIIRTSGGDSPFRIPVVAERPQRILLLRRQLAGLSTRRFFARNPRLSGAAATARALRLFPPPSSPTVPDEGDHSEHWDHQHQGTEQLPH